MEHGRHAPDISSMKKDKEDDTKDLDKKSGNKSTIEKIETT